jgi:hypothetical protein
MNEIFLQKHFIMKLLFFFFLLELALHLHFNVQVENGTIAVSNSEKQR